MRKPRFRKEKRIEKKVCDRALEELQVANLPLKMLLGTQTGWPDRLFLLGHGAVLFIEFKDPDEGEVSPIQFRIHKMLRGLGYNVQVHDNEDEAFEAIARAKVEAARVSEKGRKVSSGTRRRDRPS